LVLAARVENTVSFLEFDAQNIEGFARFRETAAAIFMTDAKVKVMLRSTVILPVLASN
jgi:hypothetical protein